MNREQLKTILWLRWRLTRNQWARGGGLGAVVAVLVGLGAILFGLAGFIAGFLSGLLALGEAAPLVVLGVWFGLTVGFLFFWLIGLVNELQRSETIDLQRLMHLPVALGQMFVVNYLASHLALSIILAVPTMMGLTLGLAFSRGPLMLLLAPLSLSLVFMVSAWTYCLRGWLAAMMSNPRRRRAIIMGVTLGFVLLAQTPNLYFNVVRRFDRPAPANASEPETSERRAARESENQERMKQLIAAQKYVPLLWLPAGALALAENRPLPALLGTLGGFSIAALGLRRSYLSTLGFYLGNPGGSAAVKTESAESTARDVARAKKDALFLERRFPALPEQATALALATFRSLLRAPEVKMAWASSFLVTLIVGTSVLFRSVPTLPDSAKPFLAAAAGILPIFMLVQFFANQFGFDRDGFRALILSPADRRQILLGKNLACLPVGVVFGVVPVSLIATKLSLPPLDLAAALLQLVTLLLIAGLAGNLLSIVVPYRIRSGSMKPTKMPGLAMLIMFVCHLLFPLVMAPVFVPPLLELLWHHLGWPAAVPVNLLLSAGLAGLMSFAYWQALKPLGRLLQRRETAILNIVTAEVE